MAHHELHLKPCNPKLMFKNFGWFASCPEERGGCGWKDTFGRTRRKAIRAYHNHKEQHDAN